MWYLTAIFLLLFGAGIWMLLREFYPTPSRAIRTAIAGYHRKEKNAGMKELVNWLAQRIQPIIRIGRYKRIRLENTLRSAHVDQTPEQYQSVAAATAIINSVLWVALGFLISPLMALPGIGYGVICYYKESHKAEKAMKAKRDLIDLELPHLANTIAQELLQGRNVVKMLTSYRAVCGDALASELDITLADMNTGVRKDALGRLGARVGSRGLSQICRGLQSVMDGHDERNYFQIISTQLEMVQDQQTERIIQRLFLKIKPYSMGLLFVMLAVILGGSVLYILKNTQL